MLESLKEFKDDPAKRPLDRRLSVAPMMDWTDRFDRYFLRLISKRTMLFTEMVTANAILHGDRSRLLDFDTAESPIACQLGGSDPKALSVAARAVQDWGYDEVNLNIGCPSDRVQSGSFGACLMAEPQLVADCVAAMRDAVDIPVTVKSRIGIDGRDSYAELCDFINTVQQSGCSTFIVHARIAVLSGLSPKENREIPPLKYGVVRQLKADFPSLEIILNGGVTTMDEIDEHLEWADGVMVGRAAYQNPFLLAEADSRIFGVRGADIPTRHDIVFGMLPYIEVERSRGTSLHHVTRHMLGLFNGMPGARAWRRYLSENAYKADAGPETVEAALSFVTKNVEKSALAV